MSKIKHKKLSFPKKKNPPSLLLAPTAFKCFSLQQHLVVKGGRAIQSNILYKNVTTQIFNNQQDKQKIIQKQSYSQIQQTKQNFTSANCKQTQISILRNNRINIYRSRKDNKFSLSKHKPKQKITQNNKLILFFSHQLVSLFQALGKRQQFISLLRTGINNKKQFVNYPLKYIQIQQKLKKIIDSKGRQKGRKIFSQNTNDQLKYLKYKSKSIVNNTNNSKKKKNVQNDQQDGISEDQNQYQDQCTDFGTWKRRNNIHQNQKVFIIKRGYQQLRQTLVSYGWVQNQDVYSPFFNLKWTTKLNDIPFSNLANYQSGNHFNNNQHLTSKYGLTRRLRGLQLNYAVNIDAFYPRCYDIGDSYQFQNFIQQFKFTFSQSVAKRFLIDKNRYKGLQLKIRTILKILKKKSLTFTQKVAKINQSQFPFIDSNQWQIITQTCDNTSQYGIKMMNDKLKQYRQLDQDYQQNKTQSQYFQILHKKIQSQLQKIQKTQYQYQLNGYRNIWIAKPNFLSRGRGIRCFNNLYQIADYCLGRDCQFVIQKYIQKPLLIQGRKFDIRQWVIVQDYNPPKIYFYQQCYLRFCMDNFDLQNIHNRFIHLTNNSIQKHNKKAKLDQSMWTMQQFKKFISEQKWQKIQNKIKNIIVWAIKSCQSYITPRKNSTQTFGFDFMIDQKLQPWLIQVNMSPSMDTTTPVTKKLVKQLLKDTATLINHIAHGRSKSKIGNFTCIYEGDSDLQNFQHYVMK